MLMRHNLPLECAAELCGVSHKTDFMRRQRALATVAGCQDRFVLCDSFWIDETHINDIDPSKGYEQVHKRGLSREKPCA